MDSSVTTNPGSFTVATTVPTVFETVEAPGHVEQQSPHRAESEQPLKVLRTLRKFSQQTLAKSMGTSQGEISRIEKRKDMHVSTLRSYIKAIGGEVVILAKFPNEEAVQITI